MEIINQTQYPHLLYRTCLDEDVMAAAIMVRVTYDLPKPSVAVPAQNQVWKLYVEPWETPFGPMESDMVFRRGGVDILVFGHARTLDAKPVQRMEVKVALNNKLAHSVLVIGDRIWENLAFGIRQSDPVPFSEMPLSLYNAYGGKTDWDGFALPYSNNPFGKGFVWEKENVSGTPLPNLEIPGNTINTWKDQPDPTGVVCCPMGELRMRGNIEFNEEGQMSRLDPKFFNFAFPGMISPEVTPGETIVVKGVTHEGLFEFTVPRHMLSARLCFGEKTDTQPLQIDQIGLAPDNRQAFVTYRFPFRYMVRPMEKRIVELLENQI